MWEEEGIESEYRIKHFLHLYCMRVLMKIFLAISIENGVSI